MKTIPIFYDERMNATPARTDSPSAGKPALVVADWMARELPVTLAAVAPATPEQFKLAHYPEFVDSVLACRRVNGFGCKSESVARALPWTTGSMLSAAEWVLSSRGDDGSSRVAVSPTSGFHHAGWDNAEGFCTFNGLMVTALTLLRQHMNDARIAQPLCVGILDCDEHFGNGTEEILHTRGILIESQHKRPDSPGLFRVDGGSIAHWTAGEHFHTRGHADEFMKRLPSIATNMAMSCNVILYQAGADQHVDDPYGGMLDNDQLRERDRIVFEACARFNTTLGWNLAGGYQRDAAGSIEPVLAIHRATMEECVRAFIKPEPEQP